MIFIDVAHSPYIYCNRLCVIIILAAFQKVSEATPVLVSYTLNCVFGEGHDAAAQDWQATIHQQMIGAQVTNLYIIQLI